MLSKIFLYYIYFFTCYKQLEINMQVLTLNIEGLLSKTERDIEIASSDFFKNVKIPSDNQIYIFAFQELFEATFFGVSGQLIQNAKQKLFSKEDNIQKGLNIFLNSLIKLFKDVHKRIVDCQYINEQYLGTTTNLICYTKTTHQPLDVGVSNFIHKQIYTEHGAPTNKILYGVKSGYSIDIITQNFNIIFFNFHLDSKNINNRKREIDDVIGKTIQNFNEILQSTQKKIFVIITGDLNARTGTNLEFDNISDEFNQYLFNTMSQSQIDHSQDIVQKVMESDEWKQYLNLNDDISYLDKFLQNEQNTQFFESLKELQINFRPTYSYFNHKQIKDQRRNCFINDKQAFQIRKESDKLFRNNIKNVQGPSNDEIDQYNKSRQELLLKVATLKQVQDMCLEKYPDILLKTGRATSYTDRIFWTQNILKNESNVSISQENYISFTTKELNTNHHGVSSEFVITDNTRDTNNILI